MIRRPLRPLARILRARLTGEDPDKIEAEARAARMRSLRAAEKRRAELRLWLLAAVFLAAFASVGGKMFMLATTEAVEPVASVNTSPIVNQRADIVDRNGAILATNLVTASLYANPQDMIDRVAAAEGLAQIFPDLSAADLLRQFSGTRKFIWVRRKMSPEQQQAVYDLGEPGLQFGPRELRLYPNGAFAAHILGGTSFGREGVHAAEVIGTAGVELAFDTYLRDPANEGAPLRLSLDMPVQSALEQVLAGGMALMNARAASAVLMEADTGRIVAMASLPDFDPNHRPLPPSSGDPADSPLFNRAAQGRYELGSTFKIFTAAQAMESGFATPETIIDTSGPLSWGRFRIRDFRNYGPRLSLMDVMVHSSNIGTARLAAAMGTEAQQGFFGALGMLEPLTLELPESVSSNPSTPARWSELSTMTISYGHGLAATPVHLAAAYASLVNGGLRVRPSLLMNSPVPSEADRIVSPQTSANIREMLRAVVVRGTASLGEVEGYEVGGKTGTADKPNPQGGYYEDRVIATFAGAFPMSNPRYVLIVTLDEPVDTTGTEPRRTAGWTSVPVGAEIIRRIAPLLGMRPNRTELAPVVMASQ
ncbi:MAG: penicillin-binding protein 2 [Paracoccaceae bacterium]